jgi:hypothetical protein
MMKFWEKILAVAIVFMVTILSCLHIFVNLQGKAILAHKLQQAFKREVQVGSVSTTFPATLYVTNIDVKGLFTIDEVVAAGGLFDIFNNSFRLSMLKIVNPVVTIERGPVAAAVPSPASAAGEAGRVEGIQASAAAANTKPALKRRFLLPPFYIGRLVVSGGVVNFIDKGAGDSGISLVIKDLELKANNLGVVAIGSQISTFELKGSMPWNGSGQEGSIEAGGWVNLYKRDIGAKLNIKDIDGVRLYPYYAKWVNLEKSRIQQAKLNFSSEITGHNNDVIADCHLTLTDVVFRPREEQEGEDKAYKIAEAVLGIFKALNGGIKLDFTVRTKLDRPEFGFEHIRSAVEEKIAESTKEDKVDAILLLPSKVLESAVKSAAGVTKALIGATAAVGAQIKKGAEEIFRKEDKKEQPMQDNSYGRTP